MATKEQKAQVRSMLKEPEHVSKVFDYCLENNIKMLFADRNFLENICVEYNEALDAKIRSAIDRKLLDIDVVGKDDEITKDYCDDSLLLHAVAFEKERLVETLLEMGADKHRYITLYDKETALGTAFKLEMSLIEYAYESGNKELTEILQRSGLSLTPDDMIRYAPNLERIKNLVDGGDLDLKSLDDYSLATSFRIAAENEKMDVIEYLLANGANSQARLDDTEVQHVEDHQLSKAFPLLEDSTTAQLFINHGATLDGYDLTKAKQGQGGDLEAVVLAELISMDPPLDRATIDKFCPTDKVEAIYRELVENTYIDYEHGNTEAYQKVIDYFGLIDSRLEGGKTALMIAAENENQPLVEFLIKAGADPNLQDNQGRTALQIAEAKNNDAIAFAIDDHLEALERNNQNSGASPNGTTIDSTQSSEVGENKGRAAGGNG